MAPHFLVVDEDPILARTVKRIVRDQVSVLSVPTAAHAESLWSKAQGHIVDLALRDRDGLDLVGEMVGRYGAKPCMVLSASWQPGAANRAFDYGAHYCERPLPYDTLTRFLRAAVASPQDRLTRAAGAWLTRYALSQAEHETLLMAARGDSQEQIATARGVTRETVKSQTKSLLLKTGDTSLVRAALRCVREGPA